LTTSPSNVRARSAGCPHGYPLLVRDHGLATSWLLLMRSLPYVMVRLECGHRPLPDKNVTQKLLQQLLAQLMFFRPDILVPDIWSSGFAPKRTEPRE
jgi:hypothetical protein